MIAARVVALAGLLVASPVLAQTVPFDMTPERGGSGPTTGQPAPVFPAQAPSLPPAAAPPAQTLETSPQPAEAPPPAAVPPATEAAAPAPVAPSDSGTPRRYLVPAREMIFDGEMGRRTWSLFLTSEEAAAGRRLHLTYQNAIVVAPELSRLTVTLNEVAVVDIPIAASDAPTDVVVDLPPGLLKQGGNTLDIAATMRHRTDCTIQSTYELWTEIDPAGTYIGFDPASPVSKHRLDDLRAAGVDRNGDTRFEIVTPRVDAAVSLAPIVRLAEALALSSPMPNPVVSVATTARQSEPEGRITAVVGTPEDISGILASVPEAASRAAFAGFVDDAKTGPSTLVVSGPTWVAIGSAVETLLSPVDRPTTRQREVVATRNWRLPDAPIFRDAGSASLAELGVPTQEFNGRRFRTSFSLALPSDFYANDYGEATLLLDAAYAPSVLPGSHIDIYVNGNIASTMPISQTGGEILRHLPIGVTMRHLRPGANTITIEAILLTNVDAVCAPGATASADPRFVLFDTTVLEIPRFARIGMRPNLAALAGNGFPYGAATDPVPLIISPSTPEALSAAAGFMARLSMAAGRAIPIDTAPSAGLVTARDAILVGAIGDMAPEVLTAVGVATESREAWADTPRLPGSTAAPPDTAVTFDKWRQELSGSGWRGRVSSLEEWLKRNFDFTLVSLFGRADVTPVMPKPAATFLVAQHASPTGAGTWTLLSAPSARRLQDGMQRLSAVDSWTGVGGRLTMLDGETDSVAVVPASAYSFVPTQPGSFANYRLIAANWLSVQRLAFAGWLIALCLLLGVSTSLMLRTLGRRL